MSSEFSPVIAEHNRVVSCLHNRAVEYNSLHGCVLKMKESDQSTPPGVDPEWILITYSIPGKERSLKVEYSEQQTKWTIAAGNERGKSGNYKVVAKPGKPPTITFSGGATPDEIAKELLDRLVPLAE